MSQDYDRARSEYRLKLVELGKDKAKSDPRDALVRSLNAREAELNEKLVGERKSIILLRKELKNMRAYANRLKYLAEDYAPRGMDLPDWVREEDSVYGMEDDD
jgi:hypothetical protein